MAPSEVFRHRAARTEAIRPVPLQIWRAPPRRERTHGGVTQRHRHLRQQGAARAAPGAGPTAGPWPSGTEPAQSDRKARGRRCLGTSANGCRLLRAAIGTARFPARTAGSGAAGGAGQRLPLGLGNQQVPAGRIVIDRHRRCDRCRPLLMPTPPPPARNTPQPFRKLERTRLPGRSSAPAEFGFGCLRSPSLPCHCRKTPPAAFSGRTPRSPANSIGRSSRPPRASADRPPVRRSTWGLAAPPPAGSPPQCGTPFQERTNPLRLLDPRRSDLTAGVASSLPGPFGSPCIPPFRNWRFPPRQPPSAARILSGRPPARP